MTLLWSLSTPSTLVELIAVVQSLLTSFQRSLPATYSLYHFFYSCSSEPHIPYLSKFQRLQSLSSYSPPHSSFSQPPTPPLSSFCVLPLPHERSSSSRLCPSSFSFPQLSSPSFCGPTIPIAYTSNSSYPLIRPTFSL